MHSLRRDTYTVPLAHEQRRRVTSLRDHKQVILIDSVAGWCQQQRMGSSSEFGEPSTVDVLIS